MTDKAKLSGISGSTLKLIAIITMLIDHTGATVIFSIARLPAVLGDAALRSTWQNIYSVSRDIGRLAFPIFCFLLVEGFLHTRSPRKYAARLFLFALISEVPFDIALKGSWYYPDKQNVYFTLLIGLLVLIAIRWITDDGHRPVLLSVLPIALGMFVAWQIDTDYNFKGVFLIAILYLMRQSRLYQCVGGAAAIAWELPAPIAFIPVYFYNGKRGFSLKYFFYWFYPVHLMLLYVINTWGVPLLGEMLSAA
ncbi:MAG: conjugal transfer protein TraX [Lachnospiraceae bacterium]|nr:conjugal transfer protein TraX [Lachnospiraceae bacterium]